MNPDSGKVVSLEEVLGRELLTPDDLIEAQRLADEQGLVRVSAKVASATAVGLKPRNRKQRRTTQKRQRAKQRQVIRDDRRKRREIIQRAKSAMPKDAS